MTQESTEQPHRQPHQRRLSLLLTDKRIYHVTSACPQNLPSGPPHGDDAKSLWQQTLMPQRSLLVLQIAVDKLRMRQTKSTLQSKALSCQF